MEAGLRALHAHLGHTPLLRMPDEATIANKGHAGEHEPAALDPDELSELRRSAARMQCPAAHVDGLLRPCALAACHYPRSLPTPSPGLCSAWLTASHSAVRSIEPSSLHGTGILAEDIELYAYARSMRKTA